MTKSTIYVNQPAPTTVTATALPPPVIVSGFSAPPSPTPAVVSGYYASSTDANAAKASVNATAYSVPASPTATINSMYSASPAPAPRPIVIQSQNNCLPMPPLGRLGRQPVSILCPYCHQQSVTYTMHKIDTITIVSVILLLLLFWPLCWVPLVVNDCKTTEHTCGQCHQVVGKTEPCNS